jgi:hypothetical protein
MNARAWFYSTSFHSNGADLAEMDRRRQEEQETCDHDWRGVDWGRICAKCWKEDRQS